MEIVGPMPPGAWRGFLINYMDGKRILHFETEHQQFWGTVRNMSTEHFSIFYRQPGSDDTFGTDIFSYNDLIKVSVE